MAFLHGPKHLALRRSLLPLFTKRALSTYLKMQEEKIHTHLDRWVKETEKDPKPIRIGARDVNIDTSLEVCKWVGCCR
jgi:cytochrome P450